MEKDIRNGLRDYPKERVELYITYLQKLKKEERWFGQIRTHTWIDLFKKVAIDHVYIDGDNITFTYRKSGITVSYNYKAMMAIMLNYYPESIIDLQLVYDGDKFSFEKEDGKVHYKHSIGNPFSDDKKIIGSYCIVKNKRGEFIEVLNRAEITKIKNSASTKYIWDAWEGEMIKKSNIKRVAKHFQDKFQNAESLDNQNYNPENALIDKELQRLIEDADTEEGLQHIYKTYAEEISERGGEKQFMALLGDRKVQIRSAV